MIGSGQLDSSAGRGIAAIGSLRAGLLLLFAALASLPTGTALAAGPPLVETTGTPLRTATTAQLLGRVDPSLAPASFRFQYGTEGPCSSNPCATTEPRPILSADQFRFVAGGIDGLEPDTVYHYRLLADNGDPGGPVAGADMTLTTRAGDPPLSHGAFPGPPGSDRAWELVSMADAGGNPVSDVPATSADGNSALYGIYGGTPLSESGSGFGVLYFAERPAAAHPTSGWQTRLITPPRDPDRAANGLGGGLFGPYPADLSSLLYRDISIGSGSGVQLWRLSATGSPQLLFETTPSQEDEPLDSGETNVLSQSLTRGAGSLRALRHLRGAPLDPAYPGAATIFNTYDIASGTPELISLLPGDEVAACRSSARLIDDSHALIQSPGNVCTDPAQLYLRDLDAGQTTAISPPPASGPSCRSAFIAAEAGGLFFATTSRLLASDLAAPDGCSGPQVEVGGDHTDIYRYDLADAGLDCVTCVLPGSELDVSSARSVAVAEDGSRLYFLTARHLLPGASPAGISAAYRLDFSSRKLAFLAPLVENNSGTFVITSDGTKAVFRSADDALSVIGGPSSGATEQAYLYDDTDRSLVCVSCPADGSEPVDAINPGGVSNLVLAEDGTVAFSTPSPLASGDLNTVAGDDSFAGIDVYEWRDGSHLLVSDGRSRSVDTFISPAAFRISPSGRDLFFLAPARYTTDALDSYVRLYDARVGGGIAFPPQSLPCPLQACPGTPAAVPEEQPFGTSSFRGPGNPRARGVRRCRKGKVRRHGRCLPKRHGNRRRR